MMLNKLTCILFGLCVFLSVAFAQGQSSEQKKLEAKRLQYQKEIKQINALLFSGKKKEKSVITSVEDLNYKVRVRKNLIKITNEQANLLTREINSNQKEISNLRAQLKQLKENYAAMVVKSYKSKSEQSRVMFLLSSDNFKQAYKRLQYLNQYTDYQKAQGEEIKKKTKALQDLNLELLAQKADKQKLVAANRQERQKLELELKSHEELMKSIRKNLSSYTAQIKNKQQEINKLDKAIDRLIKEAIAASNKKAGKSSSSSKFALTPANKALAKSFVSNKGKLPWPVKTGLVKMRYGRQPSTIDRTLTVNSNGVRIATEKKAKVKAVFDGEISEIVVVKNANPAIIVRHGNYLTVYTNLSKLYVKKGDKVKTQQEIGEVFTDKFSGETILGFSIYKDSKTQNPAKWIYKM